MYGIRIPDSTPPQAFTEQYSSRACARLTSARLMGSNGLSTSRPSPSIPISAASTSASAALSPAVCSSAAAEARCPGKKSFAPLTGERLPGDVVGDGTYTRPNADIGIEMVFFTSLQGKPVTSGLRNLAIPPISSLKKNPKNRRPRSMNSVKRDPSDLHNGTPHPSTLPNVQIR